MFINPRITVLTFIFVLGLTLTNCNQSGGSNDEVKNRAPIVKKVGMAIRLNEDMRNLSAEPRNKAWLEVCDPMQIPLEGYSSWAEMERVYFNE